VSFNLPHVFARLAAGWYARLLGKNESDCAPCRPLLRDPRTPLFLVRQSRGGLALVLAAYTLLAPSLNAQDAKKDEYRAKATFLAAFPNFIDWPPEAFSSEQTPLLLCVFGDFPFGTTLAEMTRGVSIRGHRIEVQWVRKRQNLRACHVLFISRSENKNYRTIFKVIQGASVLTVGESPDFLESGGTIDFLMTEDKLQFEVNLGAANDARIRISSNMLVLARHVVTKAEAAKS
jgi:hypothetical protein